MKEQPQLVIGDNPQPTINFRLERGTNGVAVVAKHSADRHWQTLAEFNYDSEGYLKLHTRDIHEQHLLQALGVEPLKGITTTFTSKALGRSEA